MENALDTTQRLVADHRNSLESAAQRQRLVKGSRRRSSRMARWANGRHAPSTGTTPARLAHPVG